MLRLIIIAIILCPLALQAQLPEKWNLDYTIKLSHTGSMSGDATHIEYSYEKCMYEYISPEGKTTRFAFKMTKAMREEVLAKMNTLKIDKIKSGPGVRVVNDGWFESICLGTHCIEGGTSAALSREDKDTFILASGYLEQFAMERKPK